MPCSPLGCSVCSPSICGKRGLGPNLEMDITHSLCSQTPHQIHNRNRRWRRHTDCEAAWSSIYVMLQAVHSSCIFVPHFEA